MNIKLVIFDFDGVLTDNYVYVCENGNETVKCNRSDGIGISRIQKIGIKCFVISSEKNAVVEKRCKKLNIPLIQNVLDKEIAVLDICKEYNIDLKNTLFLGNDINDLKIATRCFSPPDSLDTLLDIKLSIFRLFFKSSPFYVVSFFNSYEGMISN